MAWSCVGRGAPAAAVKQPEGMLEKSVGGEVGVGEVVDGSPGPEGGHACGVGWSGTRFAIRVVEQGTFSAQVKTP